MVTPANFSFLNKLELPRGSIDFGRNVRAHDRAAHSSEMKVLASFADQFYALRQAINFVRNRLLEKERKP